MGIDIGDLQWPWTAY